MGLELRVPVTPEGIKEFTARVRLILPDDYLEFLKMSNGAEGFVGESSYVVFWPLEEIPDLNVAYEVDEYAPGLLLIGSNGGGEAYAFDTRDEAMPVVEVPFVGMDLQHARQLASTFADFLGVLYEVR